MAKTMSLLSSSIINFARFCQFMFNTLAFDCFGSSLGKHRTDFNLQKSCLIRAPAVLKDGLIANKIFSGTKPMHIQSDDTVHIESGSEQKRSSLTVDKFGIHANCDRFQINDRTGSKLVAIDSSQIQVYTNDLSIISEQKRFELPQLITSSISSEKNLSLSASDGRLILSSNSDIDISARESVNLVGNDIVLKAHTIRLQNEHIYFEKLHFFDRAKAPIVARNSQSYSVCICENGLVFAALDCRQHTFDCRE